MVQQTLQTIPFAKDVDSISLIVSGHGINNYDIMKRFFLLFAVLVSFPGFSQELNAEAKVLKNAADKDMAAFYTCIENRAFMKYGHQDDARQVEYINDQAVALFQYFELRDSLIHDPAAAAMMLRVAWKWGAREGGICEVEWVSALAEIRANLSATRE